MLTAIAVTVIFLWLGREADRYRDMFSVVRLGMSKTDLTTLVGAPILIDTTNSASEVWTYDVPPLFAERPRCFFRLGDSILVRFEWEPIDTSLVVDDARGPGGP